MVKPWFRNSFRWWWGGFLARAPTSLGCGDRDTWTRKRKIQIRKKENLYVVINHIKPDMQITDLTWVSKIPKLLYDLVHPRHLGLPRIKTGTHKPSTITEHSSNYHALQWTLHWFVSKSVIKRVIGFVLHLRILKVVYEYFSYIWALYLTYLYQIQQRQYSDMKKNAHFNSYTQN